MWEYVGMAREKQGLMKAVDMIRDLRAEFWHDVRVPRRDGMNNELEKH